MEEKQLKQQMMRMWRDTFHDADDYVRMVFDHYFSPETVLYHAVEGRVTSALMMVPYTFGWSGDTVTGLYLCGLMTDERYRRHGLMNDLIEQAAAKAREMGCAFCFLIPASEGLSRYYSDRGFSNAFYRVLNNYTSLHDFAKEYKTALLEKDERVGRLKINYYDSLTVEKYDGNNTEKDAIISFVESLEQMSEFIIMRHSKLDMRLVLDDNNMSGGKVYYCKTKNNDLTAVAVTERGDNDSVIIRHLFASDLCSRMRTLDGVRTMNPERSLGVYEYPEDSHRAVLWNRVYGATDPNSPQSPAFGVTERVYDVAAHAHPYGMLRIVDIERVLALLASWRRTVRARILIKDDHDADKAHLYNIDKGECIKQTVAGDELAGLERKSSVLTVTARQLQEILCRRPDRDNIIMEAFGLPRLGLNMCLLLD